VSPAEPSSTPGPLPLVVELTPPPQPVEVFLRLSGLPHCLFLDSALRLPTLGRYSFLAADPVEFFTAGAQDTASLVPQPCSAATLGGARLPLWVPLLACPAVPETRLGKPTVPPVKPDRSGH
jgi:hypothetical protein